MTEKEIKDGIASNEASIALLEKLKSSMELFLTDEFYNQFENPSVSLEEKNETLLIKAKNNIFSSLSSLRLSSRPSDSLTDVTEELYDKFRFIDDFLIQIALPIQSKKRMEREELRVTTKAFVEGSIIGISLAIDAINMKSFILNDSLRTIKTLLGHE